MVDVTSITRLEQSEWLLAQALFANPDILLLPMKPTNNLDMTPLIGC